VRRYRTPGDRISAVHDAELGATDHLKSKRMPGNLISTASGSERAVTDHLMG
jgi:hypothetical protein